MYQCNYSSPIGNIIFEMNEESLTKIRLGQQVDEIWNEYFKEVIRQFNLYFTGKLKHFDLKYELNGTKFQIDVLTELSKLPYGEVLSYQELAKKVNTKAIQAVGTCMRKNQLPLLIPCHRIIKSNGEYGNYAYGQDIKQWLIEFEKNNK